VGCDIEGFWTNKIPNSKIYPKLGKCFCTLLQTVKNGLFIHFFALRVAIPREWHSNEPEFSANLAANSTVYAETWSQKSSRWLMTSRGVEAILRFTVLKTGRKIVAVLLNANVHCWNWRRRTCSQKLSCLFILTLRPCTQSVFSLKTNPCFWETILAKQ